MDNISTVKEIYAAFGRGDIPAILKRLDPEVVWDPEADGNPPWLMRRDGREEVAKFFAGLAALEFTAFEPRNFMAAGDQVAVTIRIGATVKASGIPLPEDELHLWTFGPDGNVTELRHYVDTAKHAEAALVHH